MSTPAPPTTSPAPAAGTGVTIDPAYAARSWEVVLRGSAEQALAATSVLLWLGGLAVVLAVDAAATGTDVLRLPAAPATAVVLVVLAAFVTLRFAAVRRIALDPPPALVGSARPSTGGTDRAEGTIICCSGGGVKSAAFSLGGLQRLAREGDYDAARAVVGVSGGGYMAGAFAVQRLRATEAGRDPRRSLAPGSEEVAALRRMTNYLAATGRVRYDLAMSLLVGTVANVLNVAAVAATLGWVAGTLAVASGLAQPGPDDVWALATPATWWALVPVAVALATSTAVFVTLGVGGTPLATRRRVVPAVLVGDDPESRRVVDATVVDWSRSLPNTLVGFAVVLLAVYPGAPVVAVWAHNLLPSAAHLVSDAATQVIAGTGLFGVAAWLARSTVKGVREAGAGDGARAAVLARFRRTVAPRLGIAVIAVTAYGLVVLVIGYLVAHPGEHVGWWLLVLLLAFALTTQWLGSANRTSLFTFYRSRLAAAYLEAIRPPDGTAAPETTPLPSLADLSALPGPELVLCATANVTQPGVLPTGRNGTPFVMGRRVGFTDSRLPGGIARVPAPSYALGDPGLDVATAVAISGAAVAPVAGRETKTIGSARLLLALFNIRLGVWLPNPHWIQAVPAMPAAGSWVARLNARFDRPSPYHVVQEAVRGLSSTLPMVYVTDGGHYDNLGLVEALRRRPSRIIVLDGSGDAEDAFPTMGHAVATARIDLGVQLWFDPLPMSRRPAGKDEPALPPLRGWTVAHATYPSGEPCEIRYVKCVLPAGLSWDLTSYQLEHPGFPAVTEQLELFDEFDFEAFRQLGWSLTDSAIAADWTPPPVAP